jgi:hypothetical protein
MYQSDCKLSIEKNEGRKVEAGLGASAINFLVTTIATQNFA